MTSLTEYQKESAQDGDDIAKDLILVFRSVNGFQNAGLLIIINERLGLLMINRQTVLHGFRLIIIALNQLRSADIADAFLLRRDVGGVIGGAALRAASAVLASASVRTCA